MFFVWFYAALPVARKVSMPGLAQTSLVLLSARSCADKPCVALNHYCMRAVAVGLLSLRYVHLVHQVHQVHLAKCFVTRPAKHMSESAHCGGKAFKKNNTMCFLPDIQDKMPL